MYQPTNVISSSVPWPTGFSTSTPETRYAPEPSAYTIDVILATLW